MDKERRQAYKLEQSYLTLRKAELEKEKEVKKRADLRQQAYRDKQRELVQKFEKAEQIRNGHKALQHAKYFHNQLKMLNVQEGKQERLLDLTDKLEFVNRRIEDLENTETDMLHKLQRSINEHNQLLA